MSLYKSLFRFFLGAAALWPFVISSAGSEPIANPTDFLLDLQPRIVTVDSPPANHLTTPGVLAFGAQHEGVGDILISSPNGTFRCSGTLLPGGMHVLTAAHCLDTDSNGIVDTTGGTVTFTTTSGATGIGYVASGASIHPLYDGSIGNGYDVGIITLSSAAPVDVPRSDIYRGTNDIQLGNDLVKVGFGRTGQGNTGDTLPSGTKRAGLNSYDADADQVTGFVGSGPGLINLYDFDNGLAANDAIAALLGSAFADLGAGSDEVNSAPGDSGGPTFIEANDTLLTLDAGSSLGTFIGAIPSQTVQLTKDGTNSTTYDATYSGDATNANISGAAISDPTDVQDFKVAGITSGGAGFTTNPPDVSPGTDSSFGEISIDTRVTAAAIESYIDGFLAPPFTPLATQNLGVNFTNSAGNKSVTLTVDNLATTSEVAGRGSLDANDVSTFTATQLDPSEGSFDNAIDDDTLVIDFGTVLQSSTQNQVFSLFNLENTTSFTAGLDLDNVTGLGDTTVLSTTAAAFSNLTAGTGQNFVAAFDTSTLGAYSATYTFEVSDQDLPGAGSGNDLTLTLLGIVQQDTGGPGAGVPEPSTWMLCLAGLGLLGWRRRKKGRA